MNILIGFLVVFVIPTIAGLILWKVIPGEDEEPFNIAGVYVLGWIAIIGIAVSIFAIYALLRVLEIVGDVIIRAGGLLG